MGNILRNASGRYLKGCSGNPGGKPKRDIRIKDFGKQSIDELYKIASDEESPEKLRADIWKWFAEMYYGKPSQAVDLDAEVTGFQKIEFEGELDGWSR